jgi:hypothetical protein
VIDGLNLHVKILLSLVGRDYPPSEQVRQPLFVESIRVGPGACYSNQQSDAVHDMGKLK